MPVLDRPEIKKEDLGELAKIFSQDVSPRVLDQIPVAHFYLQGNELCMEASDFDSGLVDAKPADVQKYVIPEKFVAVYDSTGDNGTHRIAIYEKQTKYAKAPESMPVLEESK